VKQSDIIDILEYDYELPEDRIAKYPLEHRDQSKLLVYNGGKIEQGKFVNLTNYIQPPCSLYYNNTRVIHARLKFRRKTGASIEIFCLKPVDPVDYQIAFASEQSCIWQCMVGNLGKWKDEVLQLDLKINDLSSSLYAEKLEIDNGFVHIGFSWSGPFSFGQIIEHIGKIPIPPYLNRDSEDIDNERYQTVYSKPAGSVAAPTAGLHFTTGVLESLQSKNISLNEITLHVGAGTFQPVKTQNALVHRMHSEYFTVRSETIEKLANSDIPLIAAGTTTLRALESLYWLAVKSVKHNMVCTSLDQWEYLELPSGLTSKKAFTDFHQIMLREKLTHFEANTAIMIVPGYEFCMVNGLITNFHQPKSTLLLLIAAFIGGDWKKVYTYAMENGFRFLSYGDSSLLFCNSGN
jgi:S-adenosylmethionine:tRNA ribosyltransferase-isomerase